MIWMCELVSYTWTGIENTFEIHTTGGEIHVEIQTIPCEIHNYFILPLAVFI